MGLATEVGLPACFSHEKFIAAQTTVAETCKKHGKIAGFWNSEIEERGKQGYRFLVVDGDLHAMQAALATSLAEKKAKVAEMKM